jgi:hypothetical protein
MTTPGTPIRMIEGDWQGCNGVILARDGRSYTVRLTYAGVTITVERHEFEPVRDAEAA